MWLWVPKVTVDPLVTGAFRIDPSGAPVIEIVVARREDLFNALHRAPYRRRDLSPDLKRYLLECSAWVPLPHPIHFEIHLTGDDRDEASEHETAMGIHAYFAYLIHVLKTESRQQRMRIAAFVGASFLLLSSALLLGPYVDRGHPLPAFLINGCTVGGWVFLWEALSIAFIRQFDRRLTLARYQRLVDAPISFVSMASLSD